MSSSIMKSKQSHLVRLYSYCQRRLFVRVLARSTDVWQSRLVTGWIKLTAIKIYISTELTANYQKKFINNCMMLIRQIKNNYGIGNAEFENAGLHCY